MVLIKQVTGERERERDSIPDQVSSMDKIIID